MSHVIAVSNQKGGVGKTTTTVNVAACLADAGHPTLLVDLDPQGNASSGLGLPKEEQDMGIADVLLGFRELRSVLRPTALDNLHLAPATPALVGVEVELTSAEGRERRLAEALREAQLDYDFILMDCPPSLGFLTVNAFAASDGVLIPVQAEYYAMEGLGDLLRTMVQVQRGLNPKLRREGIVLTMLDTRNNLCRTVEEQVRGVFKGEVFQASIPRNVRLGEAPSHGKPIVAYDPDCAGAKAYQALATEIIARHPRPKSLQEAS